MSKQFKFKEIDSEGLETLDVISDAVKFNNWMYQTIRPFCSGRILEIGSGIGNISALFIHSNQTITLSDIRENYTSLLVKKFTNHANLEEVVLLDLVAENFQEKYASYLETFDTIFALNVVEHIEDDKQAIENCKLLLKKGGRLIILVPAYQSLYNVFDQELFHFRRYTTRSLKNIFEKNDLKIINSQYFNSIGIIGWYISGKIQKNKTIPKNQMKIFNFFVPVFKIIDLILFKKIGLSAIVVGEKR